MPRAFLLFRSIAGRLLFPWSDAIAAANAVAVGLDERHVTSYNFSRLPAPVQVQNAAPHPPSLRFSS
ncbi:hypothetical protein; putative exported protein [Cupriavidus metallidurans CH34]|uniref:Secreted protein n=1 Tax=Cupriavidus metallidurans (strain ATCC 43123 / DSM 2839 / NBRC 102507 / CH34) TaxID=266264 RepID=D3DXY8_CUPMC|nr:hypothetical protein; putative exported protein [Cupriavidus metallidurans CH34]